MQYNDIPVPLRIAAQVPLDSKLYKSSKVELLDLGDRDNLAYTYYDGLKVYCALEKETYIWREREAEETTEGLLPSDFVYPSIPPVNNIDYSNKAYNFFKDLSLILHAPKHELGGEDPIQGEKLGVGYTPALDSYEPKTNTVQGHLEGIEEALTLLNTTSAGLIEINFFTSLVIEPSAGSFYKAALINVFPFLETSINVPALSTRRLNKDFLTNPVTFTKYFPVGDYINLLEVSNTSDLIEGEYIIEIYKTNINGVAIDSEIEEEVEGELGVKVITTLRASVLLKANQRYVVALKGNVKTICYINQSERIRFRVFFKNNSSSSTSTSLYIGNTTYSRFIAPRLRPTSEIGIQDGKCLNLNLKTLTEALDYLVDNVLEVDQVLTPDSTNPVSSQAVLEALASITSPDKIIVNNGFSVQETEIDYNSGWKYIIKGVEYVISTSGSLPISLSEEGKARLDLLILTTSGFALVTGIESFSVPTSPTLPLESLLVATLSVTSDDIGSQLPPIEVSLYQTKQETSSISIQGGGGFISITDERATIEIESYGSDLQGLEDQQGFLYIGKQIVFRNSGVTSLTFIHDALSSENNKRFFTFPDEQNLLLLPNESFVCQPTNNGRLAYVGRIALKNHAITHEATGSDPIQGENLAVNIIPPTSNYIPTTPTLKGHLQGIDTALGNVVQTTAGITSRVFYTGDLITLGAGTFYLSNYGGKGTVAGVSPTPLINDDNQKKYFAQDIISIPFNVPVVAPAGVYSGNLSVRINNDNAQQRYTIEVYRTTLDGTPLPSGVIGATVGALGVTVLSILDSGLLNLVGGDISSINLTGYLTQEVTFNVNERLRYRISAEKVGTTGGNITMEVFYGSNYNSFYDVPVIADTNSVLNRSTVVGTTTTNALEALKTGKEDKSNKNQANGYAGLDAGGKINPSHLPALAITDTFVVASQAQMLALVAEVGDVAVRTDVNKSFILRVAGTSTLSNWQELLTPTDSVQSVFGRQGVVTAQAGDYNTSLVPEQGNLYFTNARAIGAVLTGYVSSSGAISATDSVLQAIQKLNGNINLKANLASPTFTGVPIAPTAVAGTNNNQIATTAFVAEGLGGKLNTPTGLTTNYLTKWNGSGFGNSQVVDNGTNVGIGTTNLLGTLNAKGQIFVMNNDITGVTGAFIQIDQETSGNASVSRLRAYINGGNQNGVIAIQSSGGNTLFGKTTDAGDGVIQANGNITALPAVAPNQVPVLGQIKGIVGEGLTTNYLPKWNGSGFGNSSIFDNGTNVGIGTNEPDGLLTLRSNQSIFKLVVDTEPNDYWTEIQNKYQINSFKLINRTSGFTRELLGRYGNNLAILPNADGRVFINKVDDDFTNQLQVAGTISASPAVNSNQVPVLSQVVNTIGNQIGILGDKLWSGQMYVSRTSSTPSIVSDASGSGACFSAIKDAVATGNLFEGSTNTGLKFSVAKDGRTKGAPAVNSDEFATLSQVQSLGTGLAFNPSFSNFVNLNNVIGSGVYIKVGNVVIGRCTVSISALTINGDSSFDFSLPIVRSLSSSLFCGIGARFINNVVTNGMTSVETTTTGRFVFKTPGSIGSSDTVTFTFQYLI